MTSTTDVTEAAAHTDHGGGDVDASSGPAAVLGSVDHLAVGRLFIACSFLYLVLGRVADVLVAAEGIDTGGHSILDEFYDRVSSFHLLADGYLFLVPAFLGLAISVLPLQLGANTIAFPRAVAASFWVWFLSGAVLISGYFVQDGVDEGLLLQLVGFGGVAVGLTVASVAVVTTVLALRTAGMGVDRVPMFAWTMMIAGTLWLVSLPVVVGCLASAYVDATYASGLASNYLGWAFGLPAIVGTAIPLLGVALEVVPVAAGTRLRNRGVLLGAVAVGGILTYGADTLVGASDPAIYQDALYVAGSVAFLLPLLAIVGGIGDTLRRGTPKVSAPLVLAALSVLGLLAAAAINGVRVIDNLDLTGTPADSAVAELAVVAGIIGTAAAFHHWATKLFGVQLKGGLGQLAGLALFVGGLASAVPQFVIGFLVDETDQTDTIESLNAVSTLGAVVVLLGVLLLILDIAVGRDDAEVPEDPWGGQTLEWATGSPPVPGGPGPIDPVTSPEPLLDRKEA